MIYRRNIQGKILKALQDTPVIALHGARQSGKSTLAQELSRTHHPSEYVTLDNTESLASAKYDPQGFIEAFKGAAIIDEVQRAPELFLAIKASVDCNRRPGRFILTGSTSVLAIPQMADALVGRVEIHHLWPLSEGEKHGIKEGFIDSVLSDSPLALDDFQQEAQTSPHHRLFESILTGGYPEAVLRDSVERRNDWFRSHIDTVLLRDVRDLSNITGLVEMPHLLQLLAARAGGLLNQAEIAREARISYPTLRRYMALLELTFLILPIHPWFTNRVKRLVKSEKLHFADTGLLGHLLDVTPEQLAKDSRSKGALVESFVASELTKQMTWSHARAQLYHVRDQRGVEVDFLLESQGGRRQVGVEVKAGPSVTFKDFEGLRLLADAIPETFHRGIVLYMGAEAKWFSKNLWALPISALWRLGAQRSCPRVGV